MTRATYLRREEVTEEDGWTRTAVVVEAPREPRQTLWTKVRLPEGWTISPASDPYVLVPLFKAMRAGGPLHVEGDVSPSLLAGVEEFQHVMACWHRGRFSPVEVVAEREVEQPAGAEGALVAFSAGVDACFSAYRHATGAAGRRTQPLRAGLMAHGFDIPIEDEEGFRRAADRAEAMLATLGIPLVRLATNVRRVEHAWDDIVGAALASWFHLLQPNARAGLVGSEFPYHLLVDSAWGSHPLTDPLLSSERLRIVHDGAGYTRPQKIETIARWPAAMKDLRVCWAGAARSANCSRCSKCVRTILVFRALGLPLPESFADVSDRDIRALGPLKRQQQATHRQLLDVIDERGRKGSWVRATRSVYYRGRRRDLARLVAGHARRRLTRLRP